MPPDKSPLLLQVKTSPSAGILWTVLSFPGNNNVVNKQTIIQKIINFVLPTESETLEQRNRRILPGHVENAWIKGALDASLHSAALFTER